MSQPPARPLRFLLVGVAGVGVQLAMLVSLVDSAGLNLQVATVVAVSGAIVHNFLWHLRWTWADRVPGASIPKLFVRFSAANGFVSLAGNAALMTVLVEGAGVPVAAASLIAITGCGVLNYGLADRLVFTATGWRRTATDR